MDDAAETRRAKADARVALVLGLAMTAVSLVYTVSATGRVLRFNDFYKEAWPAYSALSHGHVLGFVRIAPAYVGSLVLRAPIAMIPKLWGSGSHGVYVASAIPCMLAAFAFAWWVSVQPRARGGVSLVTRVGPMIYILLNPIVLTSLLGGHPEEVLGGVLCIAALWFAVEGRPTVAGVLIGVAIANKPWALAVAPLIVLALKDRRGTALLAAAGTAGAVLVPLMLMRTQGFGGTATGVSIGSIFNPPQLLWFFGSHNWVAGHAKLGIVALGLVCAACWYARRRNADPVQDPFAEALPVLALILLLRCAFDPWDNIYYHVPFVFALIAYQVRLGRMPVWGLLASVAIMIVVPNSHLPPMSHDLRAAVYTALVLPGIAYLAAKAFRFSPPPLPAQLRGHRAAPRHAASAQSTTG
jgi:hypothetical protein